MKKHIITYCSILIASVIVCNAQNKEPMRDVKLHKSEVLMVIGAEGGLNTNVGDFGVHVDYHPTQTLGIGAGIGYAGGVPRWTAGLKFYAGDPLGGFYFWGAYSGSPKRMGIEVDDVETSSGTSTTKKTLKIDIDGQASLNAGVGVQFQLAHSVALGAYGGYMFPLTKKEDSWSVTPDPSSTSVNVTSNGKDTIIKEIPSGVVIALTVGFLLFN